MKIVHICLRSFPYISGLGYQENYLVKVHRKLGHDVTVLTHAHLEKNSKKYYEDVSLSIGKTYDKDGTKIIRTNYKYFLPNVINEKICYYQNIYNILVEEQPDVIMVHGTILCNLSEIIAYKKNFPNCLLKGDFHSTYVNSATNWLSQKILHQKFYRYILKRYIKYFDRIYYLTDGVKKFICENYDLDPNDSKLEFLPLGGEIIEGEEYFYKRNKIRKELQLKTDDILLMHSGKFEETKKTYELLKAFNSINDNSLRLILIGKIPENQKEKLYKIINNDNRISYLGWKSAEELKDYLCGSDFYVQPGTESSTLQTALCCGTPCILNLCSKDKGGGYSKFLDDTIVVPVLSEVDIKQAIIRLSNDKALRAKLRENSYKIAKKLFDYRQQIKKIIT